MKRSTTLSSLWALTALLYACGLNESAQGITDTAALVPPSPASSKARNDNTIPARLSTYIKATKPAMSLGTAEYSIFLKDVLWGVHSELLGHEDTDEIMRYAANYLSRHNPESGAAEPSSHSIPEPLGLGGGSADSSFAGFNRSAVVNYAYRWASSGSKMRNGSYPDFSNDCTNFVSQAVLAGGVPMSGSGDCKHESTYAEWYVQRSSGWLCFNDWAWSTSWSVVDPFSSYHFITGAHARASFFDPSRLSDLRSMAQPGDVVQLRSVGDSSFYHSMVVTKKSGGEIYFTYHSGPGNLDVVDKPLVDIARSPSPPDLYRMLQFQY